MEIVLDAHIIWNILLTFVLTPIGLLVRNVLSEQKRLDILLNKTREEIAKEYKVKSYGSKNDIIQSILGN